MNKKISANTEIDTTSFHEQLYKECLAMAKYALASGKIIPPGTIETIQILTSKTNPQHYKQLIQIHIKLGRIIAPAKARTILIMEEALLRKSFLGLLGPFPVVRRLMIAGFISLGLFTFFQTFNCADLSLRIDDQEGWVFITLVFSLIPTAGLGASFAALFQVNKYIVNGTYENKYEVSYWIRFVLGIIAGFILSVMIETPPSGVGVGEIVSSPQLVKPLLAMLGGFSANLVYRIFNRLIESIESLITGGKEEAYSLKEQEYKSRMMVMEEDFRTRQEVAAGLINILKDTNSQTDPELKEKLNALLKTITPTDYEDYEYKKAENIEGDDEPKDLSKEARTNEKRKDPLQSKD